MAKVARVWDGSQWVILSPAQINPYPSQTGNNGKFLKTDGAVVSWATVDALPSQTGNSGKYLTTNGTIASWATLDISSKADINSPTFTGTPLAPTPAPGTNTTQIATTAYVTTALANLINGAPAALDTLDELAQALGDDSNFASTVVNSISTRAPLASPAFTGTPTAPTATQGTNTTQVATTAFVQKALEITQLDTFTFDGMTTRFAPTYLGDPVDIDHPLRLLLNINGIMQIVAEKPSTVWLSGLASVGYYIDDDGYIVLPEPPEPGSYFEARLFPGVDLQARPPVYPFKAIDIYLGD
jgi:hypothetical protein